MLTQGKLKLLSLSVPKDIPFLFHFKRINESQNRLQKPIYR